MSVDSGGDGYAVSCREGSDELAAFANNLCESGRQYWIDILAHASMPEVAGVLYNAPNRKTLYGGEDGSRKPADSVQDEEMTPSEKEIKPTRLN